MRGWSTGLWVAGAMAGAGAIARYSADLEFGLSVLIALLAGFLAALYEALGDIHEALGDIRKALQKKDDQ